MIKAKLLLIIFIALGMHAQAQIVSSLGSPINFRIQNTLSPINSDILLNSNLLAKYGNVYSIENQENPDILRVRNIITSETFSMARKSLFSEVIEYNGIREGDQAIVLSNSNQQGYVWKLFGDGTTILISKDNTSFIIGNRPQKKLENKLIEIEYLENVEVIDSHHFKGQVEGIFTENFLLYRYRSYKRLRNGHFTNVEYRRVAKLLIPPFSPLDYNEWLLGMAKELSRKEYAHRGESSAQLVISKSIFHESFKPGLIAYLNNINPQEFFNYTKHLLWSEANPREAAEKLKENIFVTISNM